MIALLVVVTLSLVARAQGKAKYESVEPMAFERYIDSAKVQLVDVRTAEEYDSGHLKDAILIDVKSPGFLEEAKQKLRPEVPVAVYCRSGKRSVMAALQLAGAGYRVINMEGGILRWQSEGREVVK